MNLLREAELKEPVESVTDFRIRCASYRSALPSNPTGSWGEIGVGTKVSLAPPSEPDWQISCIRLSSWWLTFKKIGKP